MTNGIKRTREEIEKIVMELGYVLVDEYIPKAQVGRRIVIRDKIGYKYDVTLYSLMSGYKPDFVNKNNPFSLENISLWIAINDKNFLLLENNEYKGSNDFKLNFHCLSCNEDFESSWHAIISGQGCGICAGKVVGKYNSLLYRRPDIAKEWHPDNQNFPDKVTWCSSKLFFWICSKCGYGKNKEWERSVSVRVGKSGGCPACSFPPKVVTDRNRLSILYPEISLEWHPTKNGDLTPDDVSYGFDKKVFWNCLKCGYGENGEWRASPNSRTNSKTECPICSSLLTDSKIARDLKLYLSKKYNAIVEYKILKNPETGYWLPYDIYIPYGGDTKINGVYIEVHGRQHYEFVKYFHKTNDVFEYNKKLDNLKKKFSQKHGSYIVINLRKIKTIEEAIDYVESKIPHHP